uniref:Uncharacterized protein n=2 Tax=Gasterosteus aculeatus TaxID=69293 RepID=G3N8Z5_GASAC
MERTETFVSQTEQIMEAAVESAVCVLAEGTRDRPERRDLLTSVLHVVTREAGRKICRVFRELIVSLVMENEALKHKVGHLESELKSKVEKPQTVYKIKSSDGPALSLDINQSAANPAALAMAILNSAKSRRRTRSNLQVPLVIISQPGPITSQSSPTLPVLPEKPHQTTSYDSEDSPTVVVLEVNQGSTDPDELPGEVTSLPLDKNQPISEPTSLPVTT